MKQKKSSILIISFILVFALVFTSWKSVNAQAKTTTLTKTLEVDKSLFIPFGRGGVYFPKSAYAGSVIITRTAPTDTKKYAFTQPWLDIKLYDTKNKAITTVKGNAYVYFNLTEEDRVAWDSGKLSIYQYNVDKKIWQPCKTYFIGGLSSSSYGRVMYLISGSYGTYGLAIKK
jgi:hypothetical protein